MGMPCTGGYPVSGQGADGCKQGAHQLRLLNERGRVLAHVVDDQHGGGAPEGGLALAGDQQRVHERLGVVPPDADEQAVDEPPDHRLARVDARNHLCMCQALMACAWCHPSDAWQR